MRRRLLILATVLSLLLCAATVVVWVRSYWVAESIQVAGERRDEVFELCRGRLAYMYQSHTGLSPTGSVVESVRVTRWEPEAFEEESMDSIVRFMGFRFEVGIIAIPIWFPTIVCAIAPAFLARSHLARRLARRSSAPAKARRTIGRRLYGLLMGVYVVVCGVTAILWIKSYSEAWEWERVDLRPDGSWRELKIGTDRGRAAFFLRTPGRDHTFRPLKSSERFRVMAPSRFEYTHMSQFNPWGKGSISTGGPLVRRDLWWRGIQYSRFDYVQMMSQIWVPYWLIGALLALWPVITSIRWSVRRLRRRPGYCRTCSYDLTGNSSGVCPECGSAVGGERFTARNG